MSATRFQVGNDLGQPEIAIAKLFANAYEIIRCRYHLLDVTEHVALIADGADIAASPNCPVYESRHLSLAFMSLWCGPLQIISSGKSSPNAEPACVGISQLGGGVESSEFFHICNPPHVADYFKKEGVDVVMIVCVLRRQDILAASGYAQDVKSLGRSDIVTGAAYFSYLDWNCLYESWAGAFPDADMRMINYSPVRC